MRLLIYMTTLITLVSSAVVTNTSTISYNILVMMPFASSSHLVAFQPIANDLAKRGHKVTIATPIKPSVEKHPEVNHVYLPLAKKVFDDHQFSFFEGDFSNSRVREVFMDMIQELVSVTYQEPFVSDLILHPRDAKTGRPKHDLVIVDCIFNEFTLPLAHHMGVPSIYFSPCSLLPPIAYAMNIPYPLSYLSIGTLYNAGPMGFIQRAQNLFQTFVFTYFRSQIIHPFFEKVIAKHLPESPSLAVLEKNVSFMLQNIKIPLTASAPMMPYYVEVGVLHCKPGKPLPMDLEEFMQSSGNAGVIYFSLGSYTKGSSMPSEMRDKAIEAFSQLPQKILWKYEKTIENLPKNIKLVKWVPQQDVLSHPKTRIFITHGGSMSTQESGYHGCPMLAFPLSADQLGNVANAVKAGIAEHLDWKTFTANDLVSKITLILNDKRYKENALRTKAILRDHIIEPTATASYWIEYVIRHRGAHHLKSGADNLNFFQYFLLDIIGAIALVIVLSLFVLIYTMKKIIGLFRMSPGSVTKNKQKKH